ncbi:hypothetical protein AUP68_02447 [Ilyonectria robusta]
MKFRPLLYVFTITSWTGLVAARPAELDHVAREADAKVTFGSKGSTTLTSDGKSSAILVLDYDYNVEGFPTFEVASVKGDTSMFQITYAESRDALDLFMSDGPLPLAAAMDNYRVNQYNITKRSTVTNRLIQGAFRYQKLNLTSPGTLTLRKIGVKHTVDTTPLTKLAGSFECSDKDLTRIWHTGARTIQLTEIPKGSIPDFWEVTDEGALVESAVPQILTSAVQYTSYVLDFEVKPLTGEFGFSVLADTLNSGIYISCDVLGGTISAYAGSTNLNTLIDSAKLPKTLALNEWHTVRANVDMTDISISIDNKTVFSFSQSSVFFGSFGLGAAFTHSAVFRNLKAVTPTGDEIYSSSLTDKSFLDDFFMGTNPADSIVDGSRRDRIAYSGDLDVAVRASFTSTYARSFIDGSLDLLGSYQTTPGFFIPVAKIQQEPLTQLLPINVTGLIGYSFNIITAMAQNYEMTGDVAFANRWAPQIALMLDWAHSQLEDGLFSVAQASFGGDWNYYDPSQTGVVGKFNAVYAYSLLQTAPLLKAAGINVSIYQQRLENLRLAMNNQLWDATMGAYVLSESMRSGFAQDANALAILAGVPSGNISALEILSTMGKELFLPAGPLAFSKATAKAGWAQKISPYASSYHLRAAFDSGDTKSAKTLLKSLWAPMANPSHANYTNCFWETLNADGTPGLGVSTSLCHGWSAGPTAELSRYVLGIQPTKPGFEEWKIAPQTLDLKWAKGRQRTPRGDISVDWKFEDGLLQMEVKSPKNGNSVGVVHLPQPLLIPLSQTVLKVNGKATSSTSFNVKAGEKILIQQSKVRKGY